MHKQTHIHTDHEATISILIERCNLGNGSHETFRGSARVRVNVHKMSLSPETHSQEHWLEKKGKH